METPGILVGFLETAPDAMLLVGADGTIVSANRRAEGMFGAPESGLVGLSVDDLVPADVAAAHRRHRATFWSDPTPRPMGSGRDLTGRRLDGHEFPVDVSLGTVDAGGETLVVAAVRDIADLVENQRSLAASAFIVAASDDAIYVLDSLGTVTSWNQAAERLTGRRAADVLGTIIERPFELVDSGLESELTERARSGEKLDHYRTELVRSDGSVTPVSLTLAAVRDHHGRVAGISGIARDITEEVTAQQTLLEVQRRLAETQRLARIGLWGLDVATGEVQWSSGLHEIAGISPLDFESDLASHLAPIVSEDRDRVSAALASSIEDGTPFQTEYSLVRPDGGRRYIASRGDPVIHGGRVVSLSGICQDLTERQRLLEALREADRLKDEFLGVVSHELRTPLTSIVGFSRFLRDRVDGDVEAWTEIVLRNAESMQGIVERILDYSRFQHGRVNLEIGAERVTDLVDRVLPLVASPLAHHEFVTDIDTELTVLVDRQAMDRILVNLLSNSAKFSPPSSTIRLEALPDRERRTGRFRVVDEGCGIPTDELEAVFERFHQVASDQISTHHGVGVGLSIVKGYAEAMGGSVWIDSAIGRGTTVTVEVPLAS